MKNKTIRKLSVRVIVDRNSSLILKTVESINDSNILPSKFNTAFNKIRKEQLNKDRYN